MSDRHLIPEAARCTRIDLTFTSLPVTGENPWHYAPAAQFVIVLSGAWYVKGSDGKTTVFRAGDVLYQDNTKAHPAAKEGTQQAMHFSGVAPGEETCSQLIIQVERSASVNNPGEWGGFR